MVVVVQVVIELVKLPGRTLGFSIAGGRGSTPAYEDVDEVGTYMYIHVYMYMLDMYYTCTMYILLDTCMYYTCTSC